MEINPYLVQLKDLSDRSQTLRGYLDYDLKVERLEEVLRELEDPAIWNDQNRAQAIAKEKGSLENTIGVFDRLAEQLDDAKAMLDLAVEADDESLLVDVQAELDSAEQALGNLEFRRMFSNPMDPNPCFLEIQSGSGGTEAQDWASMLLRMYLRWIERHGFKAELMEVSDGDVAGIKSATIRVDGEFAYGWLRTESGVHRLVRKSPFDSNNNRHTSFSAVFISPEIDDNIEIDINPSDVRTDTYRASGAGGQHINKTDSAVRLTHAPTGIVVACQNQRSQHANRDHAWKQLRAKLYELEMSKRNEAAQALEDSKSDIGWGSQIRSYVLDDSRIKDLRTSVETSNTKAVLDGDLDKFIEASLKQGL
ncbi:peptide chain release factor 2 [Acinetobacter vivianii]|uniref:Peptide chain release factor 2 n=2 Tax=Acinetobacter vivianii TaxID=1776742 RepID=A0AAJ6NJD3_9GAMM|nr:MULTISPECIES: peptide chain release factor 2 [Acinetobacter]MBJ8482904.1 peptide chain release factor 2 [Acinetobacter vivianii]MCU4577693.1 peptide chain release factor 2 [Acinetobacter courvalinii]MEB6479798.1 peptide chain release factor 2 [Acinetobacter vivianii]MEB6658440.1 peptide chain release factor 2 [Acinetobacter vivianii]MEB6667416.1 peptide chain release factor 2 [Acinetobacter vivianii]